MSGDQTERDQLAHVFRDAAAQVVAKDVAVMLLQTYRAESANRAAPHVTGEQSLWFDVRTGNAVVSAPAGWVYLARVERASLTVSTERAEVFVSVAMDGPTVPWAHGLAYLAGCNEHEDCRGNMELARACWEARR